eukprot:GHVQ01034776.1.p1 GENE.GHVQ01034776.1~~GHVQ01034776.1.p1  ORF type:complete len:215 (-),score=30.82 GHVQ01034776.1:101-745(-)
MLPSHTQSLPEGSMGGGMPFAADSGIYTNTLDEPIKETIMRDLKAIGHKLYYVLLPRSRAESGAGLKQWDLWGPLFLCLALSVILYIGVGMSYNDKDRDSQQKLVFTSVYVIVWIGSLVVTLNAKFLGGWISVFQSICVLGYCLFPMDIAAVVCLFISKELRYIKLIIVLVALHWSTGASVAFMSELVSPHRKVLAVYPVWLFYFSIGLFICFV